MQSQRPQKTKSPLTKVDVLRSVPPTVRSVYESLLLRDRGGAERYLDAHLHSKDN
jgi:hypothetical protein